MKSYELNLTEYSIEINKVVVKDKKRTTEKAEEVVDIKKELADLLRIPGTYKNGVESFDGMMLGREIRACEEDSLTISEDELRVLKMVMDELISREHNPAKNLISLGGPRYEEMIIRVYGLGRE